jgi:hypothetical protein
MSNVPFAENFTCQGFAALSNSKASAKKNGRRSRVDASTPGAVRVGGRQKLFVG